ncbi:Atu4866 domain-containing protein [Bradyrhizobium sp.]|uniref:Atu4866 domain-containing protein n=1 Tax=Bradyrhizobium sp. TaxID=376 RepID=UPI000A3F3FEA|nr:Atu4866 domain-containing protein [Bradyrhizobium sp.]
MSKLGWARRRLVRAGAGLLATAMFDCALTGISIAQLQKGTLPAEIKAKGNDVMPAHEFAGMWVTTDGRVRHELLPNGRYDEARGGRKSAYQGRYEVHGNHIDYWDDTGFTADGDFIDRVLHHGGMILRREE